MQILQAYRAARHALNSDGPAGKPATNIINLRPLRNQRNRTMSDTPKSPEPFGARRNVADIAPKLQALTDDVLFGDVWKRPGLSPRDRSLITVASLVALYRTNELPIHLKKALENGVTREELVEAITHLAFYSGWPTAMTAMTIARPVFEDAKV
jgi:4-carboxymuconolactone decarboxylase